jgi:hypothetical protein
VLDLSLSEFRPRYRTWDLIPPLVLNQPVTFPLTTKLVIKSKLIPQWPIDLNRRAGLTTAPPLTFGDVLERIYKELQKPLTQDELWELPKKKKKHDMVTKSLQRRCEIAGGYKSGDGLKRVDFLDREVMFVGLTEKSGNKGYKLLLSKRPTGF